METMEDVKAANIAAGQYWFSEDTMHFFRSRVESELHHGRFFVTSEQCPWGDYPRLFTIREARADGSVDTYGEFQGFETLEDALEGIPA